MFYQNDVNFRYPEEENDCCLFFSIGDFSQNMRFEVKAESKTTVSQIVRMKKTPNAPVSPSDEHSAWLLEVVPFAF